MTGKLRCLVIIIVNVCLPCCCCFVLPPDAFGGNVFLFGYLNLEMFTHVLYDPNQIIMSCSSSQLSFVISAYLTKPKIQPLFFLVRSSNSGTESCNIPALKRRRKVGFNFREPALKRRMSSPETTVLLSLY